MLFNIEIDEGTRVVGYLVADSFAGSTSVRVSDGQRALLVLPCREERSALVSAGRHETGRCGFTIDESIVPNLAQLDALEVRDEESNTLIYRRRAPEKVTQKRIFRLETHLFPLWRLDDAVERNFQFFFKGIERHGRETTTQYFLLNNSSSLYLSGRVIFKTYENYIDETFDCVAILRDPYLELAERLMTLKHAHRLGSELLGERDTITLGPAVAFAQSLENNEKALHRAFSSMPSAAIANLANPVTRQLAARTPDEIPTQGAVATALRTLSYFKVLGLREYQDLFLVQLAELCGIRPKQLPPLSDFIAAVELSRQLKDIPEVDLLIGLDREVYHHVKSAIESTMAE